MSIELELVKSSMSEETIGRPRVTMLLSARSVAGADFRFRYRGRNSHASSSRPAS
jgi:hypothetical protein